MRAFRQLWRRPFSSPPSPPRTPKTSGFVLLDPAVMIEEERMPAFKKELYYPVRLGDIFSSRYQVISKLGFGANSTVWFCRDLQQHRYIALKIYIHTSRDNREVTVLRHLANHTSNHPGRALVRTMLDHFNIQGPKGTHQCIVHDPLLTTLLHFQATFSPPRLSEDLVKGAVQQLLLALDYLHTEANTIHTDIQAKNIIIATSDESVFTEWDQEEQSEPSARKCCNSHIIYPSRPFYRQGNLRRFGLPILSDFGEARIGNAHNGSIQPDIYRAPEVILELQWTSKVDIWNVGVLIWDLLTGQHLFDAKGEHGEYSESRHLAEMAALLGPPPKSLLLRSPHSQMYWDEQGSWKGQGTSLDKSFQSLKLLTDISENDALTDFLQNLLRWDPEQRPAAQKLLTHPWLQD